MTLTGMPGVTRLTGQQGLQENGLHWDVLWATSGCNGLYWAVPGLHKLWYSGIRDRSTWGKFGAHGEHGDVFLFSNLGAL